MGILYSHKSSSRQLDLAVLDTTDLKFIKGTEVWIQGKILFFKKDWHSRITLVRPYEYVDEMLSGPFKRWKHLHKFRYDVQLNQTEIADEVEFQLPYGAMGRIFEGITNIELKRIFEHRKKATTKALEVSD
jgi:ligand-binding SRPBCC domain-containing protein